MKKIAAISLTVFSVSMAHAGLGLSNLASNVTQSVVGTSSATSVNVGDFLTQARATNYLFQQSRAALAAAISTGADSKEIQTKLATLSRTSNLQEKDAQIKELAKLSETVLSAAKKDENQTLEQLKTLSAQKKQYLLGAAKNYAIAALMAKDLAQGSKQVSMAIASNPQSLVSTGMNLTSAQGLVSDVGGIAKNSSMALVEVPQLFKKAGIDFQVPTSAKTKPVDLTTL
ncbi:hypothetical protein [Acinetobacter brisouii]